ncbi:hypothetical protein FDR95_04830 [Rhizobiaceae bacterium LC148]|nr:hypothetical protein FDR95_04830 [Rhizobiaceae bacterium LC148]
MNPKVCVRVLEQRTPKWDRHCLPKPVRSARRAARVVAEAYGQAARQSGRPVSANPAGGMIFRHYLRLSVSPYVCVRPRRKPRS